MQVLYQDLIPVSDTVGGATKPAMKTGSVKKTLSQLNGAPGNDQMFGQPPVYPL
jgi:hypothetical protein